METKNYTIPLFIIIIVIGLAGFIFLNNKIEKRIPTTAEELEEKINTNEYPTKEEWLEVYITHRIKGWTDPFQQRIAITVAIIPEDKLIVIGLTSANGQEEISQTAKNNYVHDIENIVKDVLKEYNWTKDYKLTVQYI